MRRISCGWRCVLAIGSALVFVGATGAMAAEELAARVTTAVGDVTTGDGRPLAASSPVADHEQITLGKNEGCSLLIDDDALVEMCEDTAMVLETDAQTGRRRVRIGSGEIRIIVEPRGAKERIEVHTPAAIATILGTIVHFAVDPVTGETTISSAENRVSVRSSDPTVPGATIVSPMEQIRIAPGEAPPSQPRRLQPDEFASLGGCLIDFHSRAGTLARDAFQLRVAERIAAADVAETPWSGGHPPAAPGGDPADDIVDPGEVCNPLNCGLDSIEPPEEEPPTRIIGNDLTDTST